MWYLKKIADGEFGLKKTFWLFGVWPGLFVSFLLVTIESDRGNNAYGLITLIMILYLPYLWMVTVGIWNIVKEYKGDIFIAHIARAITIIFFLSMVLLAFASAIEILT